MPIELTCKDCKHLKIGHGIGSTLFYLCKNHPDYIYNDTNNMTRCEEYEQASHNLEEWV